MSVFTIESNGKKYVYNLVKFEMYDKRGNGYILESDHAANFKDLVVGQKVDRLDIVQGVGQVARSLTVKEINDKTLTLIHNYIVK